MSERLTLAFSAGMLAVVNPCGFAMLPAYLSYFLGVDDAEGDARGGVLRALRVSAAVSLGFVAVFGAIGAVVQIFAWQVNAWLPWVTSVMGVALVVLGVAMVAGYQPVLSLPHLDRGGRSRELPSMVLFGISYAIASLSCTLPVFLVWVATTFTTDGPVEGLAIYLAYAAGLTVLLTAITVTLALARQGLVHTIRRALPHITRISGALLVVAGAFLAYWGWYERQILHAGNLDPAGPGDLAQRWTGELSRWLDETGPARVGLGLVVLIGVVIVGSTVLGRRRPVTGDGPAPAPASPGEPAAPRR